MDRSTKNSWFLILFLSSVCYGTLGDINTPTAAKVIWHNNSQMFSISASGSMSESVDYVWPAADATADGQALLSNSSGVLRFGVPTTSASHNILSGTHDATTNAVTRGSIIYGNSTPKWDELTIGANQTFLKSDGTDVAWSTITLTTNTSGNYVASITDGLAIDGGDGGSEGAALTIAFDPTELLGSRTWGDASTDTIVWTWDRATGTDPTMTFGDDLVTFNGSITMAGLLTNTMGATDTQGLLIDGDTNPFNYSSGNFIAHQILRTYDGSGSTYPTLATGLQSRLIWDYDYTGDQIDTKQISFNSFGGILSGDIILDNNPTVFDPSSTSYLYGMQLSLSEDGATISTTAADVKQILEVRGTYAQVSFSPTYNVAAGTLQMDIIGGYFDSFGVPTIADGVPVLNYFGGKFIARGNAAGTSTNYGGYFSGSGGDTNYGIYSAAGLNYLADKLIFTQTDGNEFIDSLNDGYMDIGATTAIRLNSDVLIDSDTDSLQLGADQDIYLYSDTDAELSIKGDDNTKDIKLLFESGNEGSITWMEDQLRFDFDGHIQIQKDSGTAPFIKVNSTLSGAGDEVYVETNYDSGGTPIRTRLESKQGLGQIGTFTVHDLDIVTNGFNRMTVSAAGYVRVINRLMVGADSAPSVPLHVTGAGIISTSLIVGGTTPDSLFEVDGAEGLAIETVTGNTTLDDTHSTLLVNASGNVIITLPTAASAYNSTDGIGRIYEVKKIDADADTVTIDGNGAELIEFAASIVLTVQGEAVTFQTNGTSWFIL